MKWYETDKFRKGWSIARLIFKLLLLAAIIVFLAVVLNDLGNKEHTLFLYLSLGVLAVFLVGVIFLTHSKSND